MVQQVDAMLELEPDEAAPNALDLWRQLAPLTLETIWQHTKRFEPGFTLLDPANAEFSDATIEGYRRTGMRDKTTGQANGVVRSVKDNGEIWEAVYEDGKAHGFYRAIFEDKVVFGLRKDGSDIAWVEFDPDFEERFRYDVSGDLESITVDNIFPQ